MVGRTRRVLRCLVAAAGLAAVFAQPAAADGVSIVGDLSCTVSSSSPNNVVDCNAYEHRIGNDTYASTTDLNALLLKFDIAGNIPSGAVVTKARLQMSVRTQESTVPSSASAGTWKGSLGVHRLEQDWTSGATWSTYDGTNAWPNGLAPNAANDYVDRADETLNVTPDLEVPGSYTPVPERDVTRTVWEWASGTEPNYGLIVVDPDVPNYQRISFEGANVLNSEPPVLHVEYTPPCPSDPYAAAQGAAAQTVYRWNDALLDLFRNKGGAPTLLSRTAAMLNVALFDVYNSVFFAKLENLATGTPTTELCGWEPYLVLAETPANTDADLAAGVAARQILTSLFPSMQQVAIIDAAFDELYDPPYQAAAEELGEFVAAAVEAERLGDGSGAAMPYTPASGTPGAWRLTPDASPTTGIEAAGCGAAATPGWGSVTPFSLPSGSQFRQSLGSSYASFLATSSYAAEVNEVKKYGSVDAEANGDRTSDQTALAWFWANDLDRTYKPPGQMLEHTKLVAQKQPAAVTSGAPEDFFREWSQQGIRVARLYAEMSVALADAAIVAWDMKYQTPIDLWRPISAIRDAEFDGNLATTDDDNWEPLSSDRLDRHFSPCFPAWVSGHATFAGTWAQVMENEFRSADHTDPFPLTLTTEDPHSEVGGVNSNSGVFYQRTFDSFDEAAVENAISRIFLGVHYRIDARSGLTAGRSVGDAVTDESSFVNHDPVLRWTKTVRWLGVRDADSVGDS